MSFRIIDQSPSSLYMAANKGTLGMSKKPEGKIFLPREISPSLFRSAICNIQHFRTTWRVLKRIRKHYLLVEVMKPEQAKIKEDSYLRGAEYEDDVNHHGSKMVRFAVFLSGALRSFDNPAVSSARHPHAPKQPLRSICGSRTANRAE